MTPPAAWPNRAPIRRGRQAAPALARAITRAITPVLLLAACAPLAAVGAATLDVAWMADGQLQARQLQQGGGAPAPRFDGSRMVPLGSLWKLFVYVYAIDTHTPLPDYRCGGHDAEEVYCCEAGASVGRDAALAQSCGLFFAPTRLMLAAQPWRQYWMRRPGAAPAADTAWLADPAQLRPERLVRLDSLLRVLASVPAASRADAEAALLRVVLDGRGAGSVRWFGSRLRVKTYSWHRPGRPGERLGGAAGWLADGTPIWFGGQGASGAVFQQWAAQLADALPAARPSAEGGCVLVDYFQRYPIHSVRGAGGAAAQGPLNGRYQVRFDNGQSLALRSGGELTLSLDAAGHPRLQGRLAVNEYVARVIDREASANEPEAAKALAIAARSYLQQHALRIASCQRIADSSASQRVGPNPASDAALAVARWTDQLVIDGVAVRYHRDTPAAGTLAWSQAVRQGAAGMRFDAILAAAYPGGAIGVAGNSGARCVRLARNEAWLARALVRWEPVLRGEAGYETPVQPPAICLLSGGMPYSEQSRNRIFMRPISGREDRITVAHEFLHLGLRRHPRGQDEAYVEQLARRLTDLNLEGL